ncbi:hypothetical protein Dsin_028795 [Dipteronia sinensis]|uniref:MADS-box domain-containing protein n=1 Tax=Dipteronia sinensis TaxID=43782 RepID=A0AAE0DUY5_9ROSI|nr:hypothetical protein Dsin_028795 [Dipteronia sinensis]
MPGVDQRNKRKRLDCLKKKSKELSVLCDVEVLFLCKEDGDSSSSCRFHSWPEDSNACFSLIDKFKKSEIDNSQRTCNSVNLLGNRKERTDDDQVIFAKKLHKSEMGLRKQSNGLGLQQMGFEKGEKFEMNFLEESDGFHMGFVDGEMSFLQSDGFHMDDEGFEMAFLEESEDFVNGDMGFLKSQGFQMDGEGFDMASLEESEGFQIESQHENREMMGSLTSLAENLKAIVAVDGCPALDCAAYWAKGLPFVKSLSGHWKFFLASCPASVPKNFYDVALQDSE